ncbi:MAG TPA: long-chain fatty acid--CoA ligase [Bacteroidota bacterium]|nr:long-chain fatty acid--CoA ligase [Bacteroidota bacterium]
MATAVEFSTINEMFDRITKKFSAETRPVLMYKVDKQYRGISYSQLRERVEHFALGLSSLGVKKGDMVAIISENRPEWVIADLGIIALGGVDVPIYPTLTAKQIEFIFNDARISAAIVSNQSQLNKVLKIKNNVKSLRTIVIMTEKSEMETEDFVTGISRVYQLGKETERDKGGIIEESTARTKPDDLLTIIYTSGTTGNPKGVMLSHDNLVSNMKASASIFPFTPDDVFLSFLPLCHSFERMGGYYTAMSCGATIAYAESPETVRDNLLEIHPTVVTTVPRLFERIQSRLQKQIDSSSASKQKIFYWAVKVGREYVASKKRRIVSPVLKAQYAIADLLVFQKLKERTGGRMRFFVSGGAALPRELGEFFEAVGITIIEGYGLTETAPVLCANRIDDYRFGTVGKPIPGVSMKIAEDGEILAKGPNIMLGYFNNKKATEEVIDKDGWFHTGDIGVFDAHGMLMITDRKKHLFVSSGGKNIAPQPIENLFLQSKYIDQFVLIGDKRMFLSALIVPDFDAIQEYADRNKIPYDSSSDLAKNPIIYSIIEKDIQTLQKDLANFERVRKFVLLDRQFSVEEGEITPTLKIKRKIVEERFAHLIEEMYRNVA